MKYSIIQNVMLEKILDKSYRLSDFYDVFAYDLIDDELELRLGDNYKRINHKIDFIDVLYVGNYLLDNDLLTTEEKYDFVLYINDNFKPYYMRNEEFTTIYENIRNNIKIDIDYLNREIKRNKNQAKFASKLDELSSKVDYIKDDRKELIKSQNYTKISLSQLGKIRFIMPFNKPKNKKKLLLQKQLKRNNEYQIIKTEEYVDEEYLKTKYALHRLLNIINSQKASSEEITAYVIDTISVLNIKDGRFRQDVIDIINALKSNLKYINQNIKSKNEEIKNIEKLIDEYSNIEIIDEDIVREYKDEKKVLKSAYGILKNLVDDSKLSVRDFKETLRSAKKSTSYENSLTSLDSIKAKVNQSNYYDVDLGDKDWHVGLGKYSEQQEIMLIHDLEDVFNNYSAEYGIKEMFCLEKNNGRLISHNYAFSIDYEDDKTIVRMHVLNAEPYVDKKLKSFLYADFFKRINAEFEYDDFLANQVFGVLSLKKGKIVPTIAYEFTFDNNYQLINFGIDKYDGVLRDITLAETTALNNIYTTNSGDYYYRTISSYYEGILKESFIDYALSSNLPVIFYGQYRDETHGKYKLGKKIGYEKMNEKLEELSDLLEDCDRKAFDAVCWRWFKNYRLKHFSLNYSDDSIYYIQELGLINPACFMGNNVQHIINHMVLNKDIVNKNSMEYQKIVKQQNDYVKNLNRACGFIDIDDFIDMISHFDEFENNGKKF